MKSGLNVTSFHSMSTPNWKKWNLRLQLHTFSCHQQLSMPLNFKIVIVFLCNTRLFLSLSQATAINVIPLVIKI